VSSLAASPWSVERFISDAAAEHARLRLVRQVRTVFDETGAEQPEGLTTSAIGTDRWLAFNRSSRLRRLYKSAVIALFRTNVEDSYGRLVATRVTPILIRTLRRLTRADRDHIRRMLETIVLGQLDPTLAPWATASVRVHRTFWSRRAMREQAIARALAQGNRSPFQVGLFDRRMLNARERETRTRAENVMEAERQAVSAAGAAHSAVAPGRPVLVLVV
jgi:hypothetical protein